MRKILTALAVILGIALTGCATTEATSGAEGAGEKSGSNARAAADAPAEDASEWDEAPDENEQGPLKFGESMEWEDGLYVKISKPKPFTPSEWAAGGKAPHNVQFEVKVVNNTGKMYDVSMFSTTMQSGNKEAEEVFDSDNGFEGSPMTKVLDGREAVFKIGYNVTAPQDLVLEVSPDWDHESAIFVS